MRRDPSVAALHRAVRRELADVVGPVMVACSGGADSLALAAATVSAASDRQRVVGVSVDHGLQDGSADRAARVVAQLAALGADETMAVRVRVDAPGLGPEAAAREARYAALSQAAASAGCRVVLLGHTRDDQAETVLLGLARGSGPRSIAGMRRGFDVFRRPLLCCTREQTRAACRAQGIEWWEDPHNDDPRFTRSRVRTRVLPTLEAELGPGVAAALARTADLLQQDLAALDELAATTLAQVSGLDGLDAAALGTAPLAVVARVLRRAAVDAGSPPAELFRVHVDALVSLVDVSGGGGGGGGGGRGRQVQLPGHLTAYRSGDRLRFRTTARPASPAAGAVAG